jgi:hypothetical protein
LFSFPAAIKVSADKIEAVNLGHGDFQADGTISVNPKLRAPRQLADRC